MEIRRATKDQWSSAYNILCRSVFALGEKDIHNPFALTACRIAPLEQSTHHHHDDQEIFFIEHGHGHMTIGDETAEVSTGDAVFIPPLMTHSLKNSSTTEELAFYSVAWLSPHKSATQKPKLIIPAPPTPNGPLHLGHLSGPYLAADVYHRYQCGRNARSTLFMGTDDNQCYITNKARALGITNDDVLEKFRPQISEGLNRFLIAPDMLLAPKGNKDYSDFIESFFRTLVERGAIILRSAPTVFCSNSLKFIFGADVKGECPHCAQTTLGHGCEQCGHYNDGHDLINLSSVQGNNPVSLLMKERYYFPLREHQDFLRAMLKGCTMHPRLRAFYNDYLVQGLPDVTASQFSDWGIKAPFVDGQTIYEWIEMAGAYVYFLKEAQERFDTSVENIELIEAFGFDNSFYYGLVVPALIHAYDPRLPKPHALLSNYFYLLNNEKFSTSRNHAIWANDFLARISPDVVRLYLALTRAEHEPTNFTLLSFKNFVQTVVLTEWRQFFVIVNDGITSTNGTWHPVTQLTGYQERFLTDCKRFAWEVDEAYGTTLSLNQAAHALLSFHHHVEQFYRRHRHSSEHGDENLSLVLSALSSFAHALAPLMPTLSAKMLRALCLHAPPAEVTVNKTSQRVLPFDLGIFSRIEQEFAGLDETL